MKKINKKMKKKLLKQINGDKQIIKIKKNFLS